MSSLVRPAIALAGGWGHVLALRFVDRVGKGIRGAPRDALLAEAAPPEARGRVFGFHRAMDHTGAVLGPLLAAAFLWLWPGAYRTLFPLTIVPGLVVIVLCLRLPRDRGRDEGRGAGASGRDAPGAVRRRAARAEDRRLRDGRKPAVQPASPPPRLPGAYYRALAVIGLFTLGNSTDTYLLLRLGEALRRRRWCRWPGRPCTS